MKSVRPVHPPKPELTLRVGVSGHRPKPARLPAEVVERVRAQLCDVFETIDAELAKLHEASKHIYAEAPPCVRIVTGMAEGADQMAVSLRPPNWAVDAILPLPEEEYVKDFVHSAADERENVVSQFKAALRAATTVVELPMTEELRRDRQSAYGRLGRFLVGEIDLLVAVWDGEAEEGPGGTAEVVRRCLDARIPVAWITTRTMGADGAPLLDVFPRLVEAIDDEGRPIAPAADCKEGALAEAIATIAALPKGVAAEEPEGRDALGPAVADRVSRFLGERWPRGTPCVVYDAFRRLADGKMPRLWIPMPTFAKRRSEWDAFLEDSPKDDLRGRTDLGDRVGFRDRITAHLLPRYLFADQLATYFAHVYRSAYMTSYLLAALAVVFALLELVVLPRESGLDQVIGPKTLLAAGEFLCVGAVVFIYGLGRRRRWHQRWLEYRALAEMLRDARFLAYFGEYGQIQTAHDADPASSAWLLWYLRATVRELGLPYAVLDGTFQRRHLGSVERHVIADQLGYHQRNALALARMDASLLLLTNAFFVATGLLVLPWLPTYLGYSSSLKYWLFCHMHVLTFFAAVLPALGAALAGIRETGDFERFADRSSKTAVALRNLQRDIAAVRRTLSIDDTGRVLISLASILAEDRAVWQAIYGRKRLHLPA
jgi:hypothetical protein